MLDDDDSVRAAYEAHGGELYRFCHRILGDSGHAEDAVQETFIRAWRARDRFDPALASLRTWFFAIGRNVVTDMLRARAVRPVVPLDLEEASPGDRDHADQVLLSVELEQSLQRLSDDQRQAVVEIVLRGRTSADLAAELGTSDSTVRSRLYYGLKAMRSGLVRREWTDV